MRSEHPLRIVGGRVVDPGRGVDRIAEVALADGVVRGIDVAPHPDELVVDATGCLVVPGLVDVHVHLREPGQTHKETIHSGTAAAAAGGFTTVCAMPNTEPVIDTPARLRAVTEAVNHGHVRVLPIAAVTVGQAGHRLAPLTALATAGAVAFSDDGNPILDATLFEEALRTAGGFGATISVHAEDTTRGQPGIDARVAAAVGCRGIDPAAEVDLVRAHLDALDRVGGRLHIAHVTTAPAVEAVRDAKARGLAVTAEVTPHHLVLTMDAVRVGRFGLPGDPYAKVNPPLRDDADRQALLGGLADGTIDTIATDHAPHTVEEKATSMAQAPSGLTGLELAVPLVLSAVAAGGLDLLVAIRALTAGPATAFGLPFGTLAPGAPADVTVIDPKADWTIAPGQLRSGGINTPLAGRRVTGRAVVTVARGRIVSAGGGRQRCDW